MSQGCGCDRDPIECNHEAALGQAEERAHAAERELANAVAALTAIRDLPRQVTRDAAPNAAEEWQNGWTWGWLYAMQAVTAALGPWAFPAGQEHLAGAVEPAPGPDDTAELGRRADQLREDQP